MYIHIYSTHNIIYDNTPAIIVYISNYYILYAHLYLFIITHYNYYYFLKKIVYFSFLFYTFSIKVHSSFELHCSPIKCLWASMHIHF